MTLETVALWGLVAGVVIVVIALLGGGSYLAFTAGDWVTWLIGVTQIGLGAALAFAFGGISAMAWLSSVQL